MKEKTRETNIELFRIIAMFMVVVTHSIQHSYLLENSQISNINFIIVDFTKILTGICNACFIIISGYYMVNSKFKLQKVLSLWGKTIFYSIILYVIYNLVISKNSYVYESFFPITLGHYWFITAYISLCFIAPLLNYFVKKLTKSQFKYLIIVITILYGIIGPFFNPSYIFEGGFANIIYIYLIGAYIRLHVTIKKEKQYYLLKYIIIILATAILSIMLSIYCSKINDNDPMFKIVYTFKDGLHKVSNIFLVLATINLFLKFKTTTINSKIISKLITFISPSVFSIYIIHENICNRNYIWNSIIKLNKYIDSNTLILHIIIASMCVFLISLIIDLIRRGMYYSIKQIPYVKERINKLNNKMNILNEKIQENFQQNGVAIEKEELVSKS